MSNSAGMAATAAIMSGPTPDTGFGAEREASLAMHPTVKPVALVADALRDCSSRGDLVLDPFLGSGSTLIAAEKIGRRCCGLECDPQYVDVAIRRWQAFTKAGSVLKKMGVRKKSPSRRLSFDG